MSTIPEPPPTPAQSAREAVRQKLQQSGISMSEWCRQNNFSRELVNQVLSGKNKGLRGQGHKIHVALGLKPDSTGISRLLGIAPARLMTDKGSAGRVTTSTSPGCQRSPIRGAVGMSNDPRSDMSLAERIRWVLQHFGLQQPALALSMGVNHDRVKSLVLGRALKLRHDELVRLQATYGLSWDWLTAGDGTPVLQQSVGVAAGRKAGSRATALRSLKALLHDLDDSTVKLIVELAALIARGAAR